MRSTTSYINLDIPTRQGDPMFTNNQSMTHKNEQLTECKDMPFDMINVNRLDIPTKSICTSTDCDMADVEIQCNPYEIITSPIFDQSCQTTKKQKSKLNQTDKVIHNDVSTDMKMRQRHCASATDKLSCVDQACNTEQSYLQSHCCIVTEFTSEKSISVSPEMHSATTSSHDLQQEKNSSSCQTNEGYTHTNEDILDNTNVVSEHEVPHEHDYVYESAQTEATESTWNQWASSSMPMYAHTPHSDTDIASCTAYYKAYYQQNYQDKT